MGRMLLLNLALTLVACATAPADHAATTDDEPIVQDHELESDARRFDPWFDPAFDPPTGLTTDRVLLEPLAARHAELDYAALMGSREHLQRTLHWGDWPRADFTLAENEVDLERHWTEFEQREGYAFTVLAPDRSHCVGCVYLVPMDRQDRSRRDAMLAYWVIEEQLAADLDRHLLHGMLEWIERDWPFRRIVVPVHVDDTRGAELARSLGLVAMDSNGEPGEAPTHALFAWER